MTTGNFGAGYDGGAAPIAELPPKSSRKPKLTPTAIDSAIDKLIAEYGYATPKALAAMLDRTSMSSHLLTRVKRGELVRSKGKYRRPGVKATGVRTKPVGLDPHPAMTSNGHAYEKVGDWGDRWVLKNIETGGIVIVEEVKP